MNIDFIKAQNESIQTILSMMESFYKIDNYHFDKETSEQTLKTLLSDHSLGRLWMIQLDDITVGYVILTFGFSFEYNGRDAFVDELFIHEKYRNRGVGKLTMEFIENQAKELGLNALHLEVENSNSVGKQLYVSQGYARNDRALLTKTITKE